MAEFRTWDPFDIQSINFAQQFNDATDRGHYTNVEVHGVAYPDVLVLEFGPDGSETLEYYGSGITIDGNGDVVGGRITAIYAWFLSTDDEEWYYNLEFRGFDVSAQSLYEAQLTESRTDDLVMIKAMLAGDDKIVLSYGNDRMNGYGGDDSMFGGRGIDRLIGGAGADELNGGRAHDVLTGGRGRDVFVFNANSGRDTITDFKAGVDHIKVLAGAESYDDLTLTTETRGVRVAFGDGSVLLLNTDIETLSTGDFLFA